MPILDGFNKRLTQYMRGEGLSGQLARGGIGSIVIRISNTLLGFLLAVTLARILGPDGYGLYAYVFAMVSILAIPAQFGLPRLVIRETAKAQAEEEWGLMRGVWRWSTIAAGGIAVIIIIISFISTGVWAERFSRLQLLTLFWGVMLVPLIALGTLRGAALQGLRRVVLGQLPERVLRPGIFILFLLLSVFVAPKGITADQAMSLHVIAATIAFVIGVWLLYRNRPAPLRTRPAPVYHTRFWLMAALPLAMTAGLQQINKFTDILMLGFFVPAQEIGVYRVSVQGALLILFGLQTVAQLTSPFFARLYFQKEKEQLARLAIISARISVFSALVVFLILLFWGKSILSTFFGIHFVNAYMTMMILGCGQLINASFGPVGILLNMTGNERDTTRGMAMAAISNIVLNLILIPRYGKNGAAVATTLTTLIWNVSLWSSCNKKLGINSTIFAKANKI